MAQTPKWTEIPKYPVIAGVAILSSMATIAWWTGANVSYLLPSGAIRRGEFWRLLTSVFLHVDILHLAFNLYWLWVLGTAIERVFGHAKTALLQFIFAIFSSSLDFAFERGGVGLSGVGYGLFGLLWVLSIRDERFRNVIDQTTVKLFVAWFFMCILTTVTGAYPVANVAHAAGVILGIGTGYAITFPEYRRQVVSVLAVILLFGLWGDTLGRPRVNLSHNVGYDEGRWGYEALVAGRNQEAVKWLRDAVQFRPQEPSYWFNLGIAYHRVGDLSSAGAAYRRAHELDPKNSEYAGVAEGFPLK